jgi:hypothetical protein
MTDVTTGGSAPRTGQECMPDQGHGVRSSLHAANPTRAGHCVEGGALPTYVLPIPDMDEHIAWVSRRLADHMERCKR